MIEFYWVLSITDTVPSILYILTHLIFIHLHEVGTIITFCLQLRKLRQNEAELFLQGITTKPSIS